MPDGVFMRKVVGLLSSCLLVAACGADSDGGGGGGSGSNGDDPPLLQLLGACDKNVVDVGCACTTQFVPADAVALMRPSFEEGCVSDGGRVVEVCSPQGAIGTCTVQNDAAIAETIQYVSPDETCSNDAAEWETFCVSAGGTWE